MNSRTKHRIPSHAEIHGLGRHKTTRGIRLSRPRILNTFKNEPMFLLLNESIQIFLLLQCNIELDPYIREFILC